MHKQLNFKTCYKISGPTEVYDEDLEYWVKKIFEVMDKEDILLYVFIIQNKKMQMRHLSHAQELFLSAQVPKQSLCLFYY